MAKRVGKRKGGAAPPQSDPIIKQLRTGTPRSRPSDDDKSVGTSLLGVSHPLPVSALVAANGLLNSGLDAPQSRKAAVDLLYTAFRLVYLDPKWEQVLDPSFQDLRYCSKAISEDTDLVEMIVECNVRKDWQPLFDGPALRRPFERKMRELPESLTDRVITAFSSEYIGDSYNVMLQAVQELMSSSERRNYYTCLLPVVQSSGTGKSKTIRKIAQERIVIPLCLREADEEGSFSYPLSDACVREHILVAPSADALGVCNGFWRRFLVALLDTFRKRVETLPGASRSYEELVTFSFSLFDNQIERDIFYKEVVSLAQQWHTDKRFLDGKSLVDAWTELQDALSLNEHPVILAVDEIHTLYNPRLGKEKQTLFARLKSTLYDLRKKNLCIITLTTVMSMAKLPPNNNVVWLASSYRDGISGETPVPFTELSFDTFLGKEPLKLRDVSSRSAGTLEFIAKFGRPLWYSMYEQFLAGDRFEIPSRMLPTVEQKLSGLLFPYSAPYEFGASSIAILSARLLLDISPSTFWARNLEQELVRSHLRMVYSIHENQEVIMTGMSSEPIVAEAAARIMNYKEDGKSYLDVWPLLSEFVKTGLANEGDVGRLVGRTLSILAIDKAINNLPKERQSELKYHSMVPVNEYYKALLTPDAWEKLRTSIPANRAQLTTKAATMDFETAFKDAFFHFSHYSKANDNGPLKVKYLSALWLRGTAISCQNNQELIDRVLPIHFTRFGASTFETLLPGSVSCVLEQDKTLAVLTTESVKFQDAEKLEIFAGDTDLPYIAVSHCYLLSSSNDDVNVLPAIEYEPADQIGKNKANPRYELAIYGLKSYSVLKDDEREEIYAMLNGSKSYMFDKHPRPYGLPVVYGMKPFFNEHVESIKWFR